MLLKVNELHYAKNGFVAYAYSAANLSTSLQVEMVKISPIENSFLKNDNIWPGRFNPYPQIETSATDNYVLETL